MPPRSETSILGMALVYVAALMISSHLGFSFVNLQTVLAQNDFDWTSLEPSDSLNWTSCYSDTQCARLKESERQHLVPLNYSNPSIGSAILAVIRYPSPIADTPAYRGPVLFNPGGPGISGVNTIAQTGKALATEALGEQFDLLSFDPRGVGRSTPNVSFFTSDIERGQWDYGPDSSEVDAFADAIPRQWAHSQILGQLAQDRDSGILNYITTDNVARDMLRIAQLHGQEKLQYWGFSYGTVLGATFAAMFPDRVERMVLDGVSDMEGYYATNWTTLDADADKTLQIFFDACHAAGPENCAFYEPTSGGISQRLTDLYESVRAQPVPSYVSSSAAYGLVDYATLKTSIYGALYSPYDYFAELAQILANPHNATIFFEGQPSSQMDAQAAIICTDGAEVDNNPASLQQYYESVKNSSSFSPILASFRVLCSGWRVHPKHFTGPITGNTSFPILMIGNTADPITPLSGAKKTSQMFPGSVVLTQDSPGHTSMSIPTNCTLAYVQRYFQSGALPLPGTVCPVNGTLFPSTSKLTTAALVGMNSNLDEAAVTLRKAFRVHRAPFLL